ncbi:unnamed protein product, partial [Callosobruchus maculatus]
MEQLTQRQKYPRTSENYSQISANVRLRLKQYNNEVGQLEKKLNDTPAGNMYPFFSNKKVSLNSTTTEQLKKLKGEQDK